MLYLDTNELNTLIAKLVRLPALLSRASFLKLKDERGPSLYSLTERPGYTTYSMTEISEFLIERGRLPATFPLDHLLPVCGRHGLL